LEDASLQNPENRLSLSTAKKPEVNSKDLRKLMKLENLLRRAGEFYYVAGQSVEEFNHPTRVIGSKGN